MFCTCSAYFGNKNRHTATNVRRPGSLEVAQGHGTKSRIEQDLIRGGRKGKREVKGEGKVARVSCANFLAENAAVESCMHTNMRMRLRLAF